MAARGRGASAFTKTILRGIRDSLGRFLAILGIVALGCGFYAGLQMCGPDMRAAADDFYKGTNLYDMRLVSSMGFTGTDVARARQLEGIKSVMGAATCDVMVNMGTQETVCRMSSLDVVAARQSEEQSANVILSADGDYLNRVFLREGRWPEGEHECVVTADVPIEGMEIGDTVEVLYGTTSLDDVLRSTEFEVVGKVSASMYPYTGSFGSTTLGSGMIGAYLYVSPDAFVEDYPFTEMYALVEGADVYESGSDEYEAAVDAVREHAEAQKDVLAQARLADVKADAQRELDDGRKEYEQKKADAERELNDAKAELNDAKAELDRGAAEIASGQREYDSGVAELASSREQLADAAKTLESSRAQIASSEAELRTGEESWQKGRRELMVQLGMDEGTSLADARASIEAQRAQLVDGRAQLEAGIAQAQAGADEAQASAAQLEAQLAELDAALAQMSEGPQKEELLVQRAQLEAGLGQARAGQEAALATKAQLEAQLATLPATDALDQALAGVSQLEQSRAQLDAAAAQLADGKRQLAEGERSYADGQAQLADGQAQLDAAAAELRSGRAELADGRAKYEDGLAEYEDARAEAEQKLADAARELDDAQAKIDDLEVPDIYLLDRSQSEGALTYDADTHRMDSIADVFPLMFFLVAALVALTTMTRMVDDDRIEIGTYKALGYSTLRIASKYLIYAGVASTVGAVLGIAALSQVLPIIVTTSYDIIYTVPLHPFPLPIDGGISLAAGGLGVGVTLLATYAAVVASLRETPATLMLPRAPAAGKRILLERVKPLWRHLSFSWKVTFRNLFRYKRRFAMTIIGISGCTALLLVGFGLHDAIWDIIDCQYGPIVHYDTAVGLTDDATELDVTEVADFLASTGEVERIVRMQHENMQAGSAASDVEPMRVQVVIPQTNDGMETAVTMRTRTTQEPIAFDDDSVVVTEKISLKYGVGVGDEILLYDQDDIGNVKGEGHPLTVTGVAENYVGNLVYVGRDAWKSVEDAQPAFSTLYMSMTEDEETREAIATRLHEFDEVSTVVFSEETVEMYRNMLSVVDAVVVLLIVSAGLLAFIVLYNLTNINIGERVREIASLKVLGFTKREVYAYIFREIALLAVLGDALGMVLGTYLETFVSTTAEVDYVMFGRTIHPMSYVYGFVLTLAFTALILLIMRRRLDEVNMVESLKSVE